MTNNPVVSIVIPTYNSEEYVEDAINSVLCQDYEHKEIIVVDDGSTDSTRHVLEKYQERVKIIFQSNSGSAVARNLGIKNATGKYIAFLDSDDLWLSEKLSLQVAYMERHPEVGVVYNAWRVWERNENGGYTDPKITQIECDDFDIEKRNSGWVFNKLFIDCIIHTSSAMIRHDIVDKAGYFDEELRKGQDYEYWFRVAHYTEFHKLKKILSLYRQNEASVTNKPGDINYGYLVLRKVLEKFGRVGPNGEVTPRSVIRERLASIWSGFGYLHYKQGNPKLAMSSYLKAIINRPLKISLWKGFALTLIKWVSGTKNKSKD